MPGSDTVDQGCSGTEPDDTCSATAVPNGTLVGFLDVAGLPAGPVTVEGTVTAVASSAAWPRSREPPRRPIPTGRDAARGGNQLSVQLDANGLR